MTVQPNDAGQVPRCPSCGARILNVDDATCTRCAMLDNEDVADCG